MEITDGRAAKFYAQKPSHDRSERKKPCSKNRLANLTLTLNDKSTDPRRWSAQQTAQLAEPPGGWMESCPHNSLPIDKTNGSINWIMNDSIYWFNLFMKLLWNSWKGYTVEMEAQDMPESDVEIKTGKPNIWKSPDLTMVLLWTRTVPESSQPHSCLCSWLCSVHSWLLARYESSCTAIENGEEERLFPTSSKLSAPCVTRKKKGTTLDSPTVAANGRK